MTEVPLRAGMLVQILPHSDGYTNIPPYEVKKAVGGPNPELVMQITDRSTGYAPEIRLSGKNDVKTLGKAGAQVTLNHPRISRLHATISWDEGNKSWSYMTMNTPPSVQVGDGFLADMQERAENVRPKNTADARKQMQEIDRLVGDMQGVRAGMKNVHQLMNDVQGLENSIGGGGWAAHPRTEDSQEGYRAWVQAYTILYNEQLSAENKAQLAQAHAAITDIGRFRGEIRDMESYGNRLTKVPATLQGVVAASKASNYSKDMQALVNEELKPLSETPPKAIYPASGFRGHHTVMRIEKDDKGYVVTNYNAGGGARDVPGDSSKVMGLYRQRLKPGVDVADFVRAVNERKMQYEHTSDGLAVATAMEASLSPVFDYVAVPPQVYPNCTTRSTREMLKDTLPVELFTHLHNHVSNPEVCDPAEMMAALQMRRDALKSHLEQAGEQSIAAPANIADWAKSVHDMRSEHSQVAKPVDGPTPLWLQREKERPPSSGGRIAGERPKMTPPA